MFKLDQAAKIEREAQNWGIVLSVKIVGLLFWKSAQIIAKHPYSGREIALRDVSEWEQIVGARKARIMGS